MRSMARRSGRTSRSSRTTAKPRRNAANVLRLLGMVPEPALIERFTQVLDGLVLADSRIGVAVSGGPDSLALLLLVAAARPGQVEAATVDHGFRPESRDEAAMVAGLCDRLGVPHATLTVRWERTPETALQEMARKERYRLLGFWAEERGLDAIATAHH